MPSPHLTLLLTKNFRIPFEFILFYFALLKTLKGFPFHNVSGESMENALRACCKGIKIGKILIHRDGDNGKQVNFSNDFDREKIYRG